MQRLLWLWARSIKTTTHIVELDHAHNKKRTTPLTRLDLVCARQVCHHGEQSLGFGPGCGAKNSKQGSDFADDLTPEKMPRPKAKAKSITKNASRLAPHKSALQLFHKVFFKTEKDMGKQANPCTAEFWKRTRAAWAALSDEEPFFVVFGTNACPDFARGPVGVRTGCSKHGETYDIIVYQRFVYSDRLRTALDFYSHQVGPSTNAHYCNACCRTVCLF